MCCKTSSASKQYCPTKIPAIFQPTSSASTRHFP
ncbi:hypothetical protein GQ600_8707 [Phytophthora cactorum]|nr:hypothetical protein GQ600_8707 [Phytophthora cactorum]